MSTTIVSIGYESRSVAEFINILSDQGVEIVYDVRELPLSRKRGFSKTPLRERLNEVGIDYEHIRSAGNPYRKLRKQTIECLSLYQEHLHMHPNILENFKKKLKDKKVAVLCYEKAHEACHRSIFLQELAEAGAVFNVIEIE